MERYDWARPGDRGRRAEVPVSEIKIDRSYQRPECSEKNTLMIAREFDWDVFGSLTLMQRENGDKYVVDGQQRLLAVRRRGDINRVPCLIFQSDGRDHEARAFAKINMGRTPVTSHAKYRALVKSKENPYHQIDQWIHSEGMEVRPGHGKDVVDFPSVLVSFWKRSQEFSKRALVLQREIIGEAEDDLNANIHKGIWWLLMMGLDLKEHVKKIKEAGGNTALLSAIKAIQIDTNVPSVSEKCAGRGILRVINKGKRRKIKVADIS